MIPFRALCVGSYIEALTNPAGRLRTLRGLRAVVDGQGVPLYVAASGGRFIFQVVLGDGTSARLVCFTRDVPDEMPGGVLCPPNRYVAQLLPNEIYVYHTAGVGPDLDLELDKGAYYPVLLLREIEAGVEVGGETDEAWYAQKYPWVGEFEEGRAAVRSPEGYYGLIDRDGREIIPPQYDDLSWDGSRFAYIECEGRYGCLDRLGRVVVEPEWEWMGEFNAGFAVVRRGERYGYVNQAGELVGEGLAFVDAFSPAADGTAVATRLDGQKQTLHLLDIKTR